MLDFNRFRRSLANEYGSAVLPLIISTTAGSLFLFAYLNLSQYVAARGALDAAAVSVARCISPSDPLCSSITYQDSESRKSTSWYGYKSGVGVQSAQATTYTYDAHVYQEAFGASYNTYGVTTGYPQKTFTEVKVRPQRFVALLNSYAILRADIIFAVRNKNDGRVLECRLNEEVELPAGLDFESSETYYDQRWCEGLSIESVKKATGCEGADIANWELSALPSGDGKGICQLAIPSPRTAGEQPWLLLGGTPVCDDTDAAPFSEIPTDNSTIWKGFSSKTKVGDRNRAFPISKKRQFLVVETFSCDPTAALSILKSKVRTKEQLTEAFTNYPFVKTPRSALGGPNPDFESDPSDPLDKNSFLFAGAPEMSFIAEEDWTYLEWSRDADGLRHLERKVCAWMTYEEALNKFSEFRDGSIANYQSGSNFANAPQALAFAMAPECLPQEKSEDLYTCPERFPLGEKIVDSDCIGLEDKEREKSSEYLGNLSILESKASSEVLLSKVLSTKDFGIVPQGLWGLDFADKVEEKTFSKLRYQGREIKNKSSVRDFGVNPKTLPEDQRIRVLKRNNSRPDMEGLKEDLLMKVRNHEEVSDLDSLADLTGNLEVVSHGMQALEIESAWPFIKDEFGSPVPTVRPYFLEDLGEKTGKPVFDYNLDCIPEKECETRDSFTSLEASMRHFASADPSLNGESLEDQDIVFEFSEKIAGVIIIDPKDKGSLPLCTQFKSQCANGFQSDERTYLGDFNTVPLECSNGSYLGCYPESHNDEEPLEATRTVDIEAAKALALSEVRRLIPGAYFCDTASEAPSCLNVEVVLEEGEVNVDVKLNLALMTPFKEILNKNAIPIYGTTRERLEVGRIAKQTSN